MGNKDWHKQEAGTMHYKARVVEQQPHRGRSRRMNPNHPLSS